MAPDQDQSGIFFRRPKPQEVSGGKSLFPVANATVRNPYEVFDTPLTPQQKLELEGENIGSKIRLGRKIQKNLRDLANSG